MSHDKPKSCDFGSIVPAIAKLRKDGAPTLLDCMQDQKPGPPAQFLNILQGCLKWGFNANRGLVLWRHLEHAAGADDQAVIDELRY